MEENTPRMKLPPAPYREHATGEGHPTAPPVTGSTSTAWGEAAQHMECRHRECRHSPAHLERALCPGESGVCRHLMAIGRIPRRELKVRPRSQLRSGVAGAEELLRFRSSSSHRSSCPSAFIGTCADTRPMSTAAPSVILPPQPLPARLSCSPMRAAVGNHRPGGHCRSLRISPRIFGLCFLGEAKLVSAHSYVLGKLLP